MIEYVAYRFSDGEYDTPAATVALKVHGKMVQEWAVGQDELDALFRTFCLATGVEIHLRAYQVKERFRNGNPIGKATVRIKVNEKEERGYGRARDSRKAFLLALVGAVNQIQQEQGGE